MLVKYAVLIGDRIVKLNKSVMFFALFLAFVTADMLEASEEKMLYAGYAFSGDYKSRNDLYPYSAKIFADRSSETTFREVFLQKLRARPKALAKLSLEQGQIGKGSQITTAFTVNFDDVEVQEYDGKYLVAARIYASILSFDRDSKTLIANYPVRVRYSSLLSTKPTDAQKSELVKSMYFGSSVSSVGSPQINIIDTWLDRLEMIDVKSKGFKYLQVGPIVLSPEARKVIVAERQNENAFKVRIAQALETAVSTYNGVPVVPSNPGEVIKAKMAIRFSDGNSFEMTLPEPDYLLGFEIRGFANQSTPYNSTTTIDAYRVLGTVSLVQPEIDKKFMVEKVYETATVTKPNESRIRVDAWPQYNKTTTALLDGVAQQIAKPDRDWLKSHASAGADAESGFEAAEKLFKGLK